MPITTLEEFTSATFDYLIVGGGTAGLTLAARLTEDPRVVVGVIEAGGYDPLVPEINVPGMMGRTIANPLYDWTFFSVPQSRANDRVVLQPRGKGLGGSSMNNFLGMFRPSRDELNALEELGNDGWNWPSLFEYMKKSESTLPSGLNSQDAKKYAADPDSALHGTQGPITKSFPTILTELHALLFDTAEVLGVQRNPETGNGKVVGAMTSFSSVDPRTATRSYAATGYFEPNSSRDNLLVLLNAQVLKIILEPVEGGFHQALGAEFLKDGTTTSVTAVKKDVILSAGTFQTPQLLELSGIGNPEILSKYKIPQIIDLPGVGENLQDHVYIPTIVEVDAKYETMEVLRDPVELKRHEELYKRQEGLFSSVPAAAFLFLPANAFGSKEEVNAWKSRIKVEPTTATPAPSRPELRRGLEKQYEFHRKWFVDENHAQAEILNYNGHHPSVPGVPAPGKRYTSLVCALMHPLSRGTVHITSANPLTPPAIDPNYFANETDLDLLVHITRFALKVYNTPPFGDAFKEFLMPPKETLQATGTQVEQDERLREYVRETCAPVYHPIGTAAMLPRADGGVVDSNLQVYGTHNLRVVDVSILPMELSCHTQAMAYVIGEKGADILRARASGKN
ncbi:alcohol oxidase [Infundibulicybe gibba]|nr:alcohol oxidase [Infundibulicybe gibba]